MAFQQIYCSACGLEIYPEEILVPHGKDSYHGTPYPCNPY